MLTIGTLTLDNDPYVKTDYDYKTSSNGTIIGGLKTIVLSGTIVEDNPSSVLSTAKSISDWYATSTDRYYKNITINGIAYQQIKIEDVQTPPTIFNASGALSFRISGWRDLSGHEIRPQDVF